MARENIPVGLFYATYPSDCTYKLNSSGINQADMYQLFAYGKKYRCKQIALVYPKTEQFCKPLRYNFDEELSLYCFPFDMTKPEDSIEEILRCLT